MPQLQSVDRLIVDIALDNLSDNYSSKPAHVSPEFNNVIAAGAREIGRNSDQRFRGLHQRARGIDNVIHNQRWTAAHFPD